MIYYVHRDPKFDKWLNMLRERGGTALIAVKKSEEIINRIIRKGRDHSHKIGKQTKNGELRIKQPTSADALLQLIERIPGYELENILILEDKNEIKACAGFWDWSKITKITVHD